MVALVRWLVQVLVVFSLAIMVLGLLILAVAAWSVARAIRRKIRTRPSGDRPVGGGVPFRPDRVRT
jgi:hypothetical protein